MGSIVEWQSLKVQEYRYQLLVAITRFWELFGVRRPIRFEKPVSAGDYEEMLEESQEKEDTSPLAQYLKPQVEPKLGGPPKETEPPDDSSD